MPGTMAPIPEPPGPSSDPGKKSEGYWPIPPGFWHGILQVLDRFECLIQNGSGLACVHDATGTILYASPNADRMLGYRPVELVGMAFHTLVHPDDLASLDETLEEVNAKPGKVSNVIHRVRRKDGAWRWAAIRFCNQLANPNVQGIITHAQDITDLKEAQDALEDARHRLQLAQGFQATGFSRWNLVTGEVVRDDQARILLELGAVEGTAAARGAGLFIHMDDRPDYDARWKAHLEGRTPVCQRTYRILTPSGTWKPVHERVQVVERGPDGTPLAALSALQDPGAPEPAPPPPTKRRPKASTLPRA
jgi:PAS domain S-box-containing protein